MKKLEMQQHIFDNLPEGVERYEMNGSGWMRLFFTDGTDLQISIKGV